MPHISGVINKVFNNEHNPPKTFQWEGKTISNSFNHTICLKNVDGYFDLGDDNSEMPYVKSAGELRVGDEIEFMYDNNKYISKKDGKEKQIRKIKRGTVQKLTAAEDKGGSSSSPPAGKTKAQGSASQSFGGPNPAAVGQCLNIALELGILNAKNLDDPNAQREAIITYKKVKDELTALWDAADNEPQPGVQENETQDNFDDDIPF